MKILKAEDLNELKELGYKVNLYHDGSNKPFIPKWINPHTFWNCFINDISKRVDAQLFRYVSKTDKFNVKLIRH